jgi:hypothetical protein
VERKGSIERKAVVDDGSKDDGAVVDDGET